MLYFIKSQLIDRDERRYKLNYVEKKKKTNINMCIFLI